MRERNIMRETDIKKDRMRQRERESEKVEGDYWKIY